MRVIKFLINRAALTTFLILLEIVILSLSIYYLSEYFWYLYIFLMIISIFVVIHVLNNDQDPTTKLPWLAIVLLMPPFGTVIYLMFNSNTPRKHQLRTIKRISAQLGMSLETSQVVWQKLAEIDSCALGQAKYLTEQSHVAVYQNTKTNYFESGEKFFQKLLIELARAKRFIFMEYFILARGFMWDKVYEILVQKAKQGVEIKIMYDDIGSIYKLPYNFYKKISTNNMICIKHNKYRPIVSALHNNRDHRKITIIDGNVAFTGGMNIADEYINKKTLFGHWKDCGIMISGDGVQSMTLEFLNIFFGQTGKLEQTKKYLTINKKFSKQPQGFVLPFFDGPYPIYLDRVGENAYINMINQAKKYIYITTPYLIIDYNFMSALKLAAKRGVDVKIITPHIPDKKIIFLQTQASYKNLLISGVKIFEYEKGFMHAKTIVCDDTFAIVGTFNIDYRSFVHHFENGVWLCGTPSVLDIKNDFESIIKKCKVINNGNYHFGFFRKLISDIISIFSALM